MFCILDIFLFYEQSGNETLQTLSGTANQQWEWLLFVTSASVPVSMAFVLIEIFREDKPDETDKHAKSELETVLEGFVLLLLVVAWIPTVIVATTPGGVASLVGNAYFFTWATTVFVLETAIWWIHDWRKRIHIFLQQQEKEYNDIQEEVLQRTRQQMEIMAAAAASSPPPSPRKKTTQSAAGKHRRNNDDRDEDMSSEYSDHDSSPAMPAALGT